MTATDQARHLGRMTQARIEWFVNSSRVVLQEYDDLGIKRRTWSIEQHLWESFKENTSARSSRTRREATTFRSTTT